MQLASVVSYFYVLITYNQPLIFTPLSYMVVIRQLHMYEIDAVQPIFIAVFSTFMSLYVFIHGPN